MGEMIRFNAHKVFVEKFQRKKSAGKIVVDGRLVQYYNES
jgi:hypothetical protein